MPGDFKGPAYRRNRMGHHKLTKKEQLKDYIFQKYWKKLALCCIWRILHINGEKVLKLSISQLIIEQYEKIFRSSLPTLII